jgi:hypothetical protein
MKLPETFLSPLGLTVVGAGADLLTELLDAFDFESRRKGVPVDDFFAPGLGRPEIEDKFGSVGRMPSDELVAWWEWHNGRISPTYMSRLDQFSLEVAIDFYRTSDLGTDWFYEWNPSWIRTAGTGNEGMAASIAAKSEVTLVRYVSPFGASTQSGDSDDQVVSLCTPITWNLLGIAKGWMWWDPIACFWQTEENSVPLEWALTALI